GRLGRRAWPASLTPASHRCGRDTAADRTRPRWPEKGRTMTDQGPYGGSTPGAPYPSYPPTPPAPPPGPPTWPPAPPAPPSGPSTPPPPLGPPPQGPVAGPPPAAPPTPGRRRPWPWV